MLLGAVKLLKSPDNLPDVWTTCYRSPPVMGRSPKHNPRIVPLLDTLHDQLVKQRSGADALLAA